MKGRRSPRAAALRVRTKLFANYELRVNRESNGTASFRESSGMASRREKERITFV
jgi:hypothetical protein